MEHINRSLRGLRALSNDPMLGPYQQQDLEEGNDEFLDEQNVEQPQQNNGGVLTLGPTTDIVIDFENGLSLQTPPLSGPQSQDEITTFRGNEVVQGLEVADDGQNKPLENIIGIFLYGVVKWNTVSGFLLMITIFSLKLNISPLYVPLVLCFVDIYGFLNLLQNSPSSNPSEKRRHHFNVLQNFLSVASKMALVFYVYLQNFRVIYAFAPTLLFDTLYAFVLAFKYKNQALKWFYYLQLVFKLCFTALVGSVALRVDNLIDWNWRETFLGFWIFYALLAGFTLVAILAFFDKFLNFFLPERRNHELYGLLWLVLVGAGTCIFSAFSVIKLQKVLDNKEDIENLMVPFIATSIYNMGTVFYTTSHFVQIKMFFDKLFVLEEENEQTPAANNQQAEKPKQLNSPTKLVIPRFLAKSSNTYFRRVTQDDIDKTKNKLKSQAENGKSKSKKHKSTKSIHQRKHSMDSLQVKKDLWSNGENPNEDANNDLAVVPETNRDNLRTDRTISNTLTNDKPKPRMRPLNLGRSRLPEFGSIGSQHSDRSRAGLISTQRTTVNFGELTGFHDESVNPGTTTRRVRDQDNEEEKIPSVILDAMNRKEESPEKGRSSLNQIPEEENIYENTLKYQKRRGNSMYIAPGTTFPGIYETLETSSNMGASKIENLETVTSPGIEQSANQQCLICFDKGTDAVFMECGHGGVCYECSLEIWKTTAECFLCRKKITQVLQIDPKQKIGKNIIKVISATQMVLGQEQN